MNRRLTWVFTFSAITLVLHIGSLIGLMLPTVYAIFAVGCLLSLYYLGQFGRKGSSFES